MKNKPMKKMPPAKKGYPPAPKAKMEKSKTAKGGCGCG